MNILGTGLPLTDEYGRDLETDISFFSLHRALVFSFSRPSFPSLCLHCHRCRSARAVELPLPPLPVSFFQFSFVFN
jgi:hypothetical protein